MPKQSAPCRWDFSPDIKPDTLSWDLYATHDAAIWLSGAASALLVLPFAHPVTREMAFNLIEQIGGKIRIGEGAVNAAADEIAQARGSSEPVTCAGLRASTYHELAVRYVKRVLQTVYDAADERAALALLVHPKTPFPIERIRDNWPAVAVALADTQHLEDWFRAALKLEIIRTQERRQQQQQSINGKTVADDPPANGAKKKTKHRDPGRPADSDKKQDARIYDAWKSRHYRTQKDLANAFNLRVKEVGKAIDRERKRREKDTE